MFSTTFLPKALLCLLVLTASSMSIAEEPNRWQPAMDKFAEQDKKNPPPENAILFIGSSSIRMWDLPKSFGDTAVLNRGFGGSQYADIVRHADQLIESYQPRAVVLYSGDNDLWRGKSPKEVHEDFMAVRSAIRDHAGNVPIVVIGVKPSIARAKIDDKIIQANGLMASTAEEDAKMIFIDPFDFMRDEEGKASPELLLKDGLHMNVKGYALWTPRVKEAIERLEE